MQPHQERVVQEKKELDEKISKLLAFFDTPIFTKMEQIDRDLLNKQFGIMCEYSQCLSKRISRF